VRRRGGQPKAGRKKPNLSLPKPNRKGEKKVLEEKRKKKGTQAAHHRGEAKELLLGEEGEQGNEP
jgi:hypothetical protein